MPEFIKAYKSLPGPVRWVTGLLGIVIILFILGQVIINIYLEERIGNLLKDEVRNSTQSAYVLNFEDLNLGLLSGSIKLDEVNLRPDPQYRENERDRLKNLPVTGNLTVKSFEVRGVSLWSYLFKDILSVNSVIVDRPVLDVNSMRDLKSDNSTLSSVDSSLFSMIKPHFSALKLDDFEIRGAGFHLRKSEQDTNDTRLRELNLHLRDIYVDSASAQSGRVFITDRIGFDLKGLEMNLPYGFYNLRVDNFELSSSDRTIRADSVQVKPRLPRYEFSQKKGFEIDRIDLLAQTILFEDIDFTQAVNSGRLHAKKLSIDSTNLNIFHNLHVPFPPGRSPKLPQRAFKELPVSIKIDSLMVNNTDIRYTEHRENAPEPGSVWFNGLQAIVTDLSNYPEDLESGHEVKVKTTSKVMERGNLDVYFTFFMNNPRGVHTVYGEMDSVAFSRFNPALENLGFIHAESGMVNSLRFSMSLNEEISNGTVTMNYNNLKLQLLKSETLEQGTGQKIKSFIANTFVVKEKNTNPPLRKGEIKFERVKEKSVFNFWWKSLATGLKDNIGL